jgi:Na+/melibiose symporter-like transporter
MIDFANILSNFYFKNLGLPIFSILMTTFVKVVSRKDHSLKVTRSDLAIGINLIIASLLMLINYSVRLAEQSKTLLDSQLLENTTKLLNMMILVLLYSIFAFILSVFIRLYGWQKENEKELKLWQGVIIPLLVGGLLLVMASNYTNQ